MKYIIVILNILYLSACVSNKGTNVNSTGNLPSIPEVSPKPQMAPLNLGNQEITLEEFKGFCTENSLTNQENFDMLLRDYLKVKLLSIEASNLGYEKHQDIKEEISNFQEIVANDYIIDSTTVQNIQNNSVARLKEDRNVSHILFKLSEFASPEDTLVVFRKAQEVIDKLNNGLSFKEATIKFSEDPISNKKQGELGWFTGLQMLFPLEDAIFEANKGLISKPVRSDAGYHIININNIRPSSGTIDLKYIACLNSKNLSDTLFSKSKIDSIATIIRSNSSFDQIHDSLKTSTSRIVSGEMKNLCIGKQDDNLFETARYKLKIGEISEPILTSTGWFLLKLIKINPIYNLGDDIIKEKIFTDSRKKEIEKKSIQKLKSYLGFESNDLNMRSVLNTELENLKSRDWKIENNKPNILLFKINNISYSNEDFYRYIFERQKFEKFPLDGTTYEINNYFMNNFISENVKIQALEKLNIENAEYKGQILNFKNRLLSQKIYNLKVLEPSLIDTTSHRLVYNAMREEFKILENAEGFKITFSDSSLKNQYLSTINKGKPYNLKRGIQPIYFEKNKSILEQNETKRITGLQLIMDKFPNYILEIGGHRDVNESSEISTERIKNVSELLEKNGVKLIRTTEVDYQESKLADKFDWKKNQRISLQFLSNDVKDLSEVYKDKYPTKVKIEKIQIKKNDLVNFENVEWKEGIYPSKINNLNECVVIEKISPERYKSIKETKGQLIKVLQNKLEKQLFDELTVKYPIVLDKQALNNIYLELIQKN